MHKRNNIKDTVIIYTDTTEKARPAVYNAKSNNILDTLFSIFDLDKKSITAEYRWFKSKHNNKNIFINLYNDILSFGVLEEDISLFSEKERNLYLQDLYNYTSEAVFRDFALFGPENMQKRNKELLIA